MTPRPPARRGWSFAGAAILGLLFALGLVAVACGEDGVTPDCPTIPLYNIHDEDWLEGVAGHRAEAIDAGCLTPLGDANATD